MAEMKIVFDVEGVILKPKFDLAWLSLEELVDPGLRENFYEKVRKFDEYDDNRWIYEREKRGHSTGTTPLISACIAACSGISDSELMRFALKHMEENPGIREVLDNLEKDKVYLVTSSWPGVPQTLGYLYKIPQENVFSMGHQLSKEEVQKYSWNPKKLLYLRSPISSLNKYPKQLKEFLEEYLENCAKWNEAYKNGEEEKLNGILEEQLKIFNEVEPPKLRKELNYLLLEEKGIMGGHRKREVLESLGKREEIIYFGDSIVDADALAYAGFGVSVNCTNEHALKSSNLNIATEDLSDLGKVISAVRKGEEYLRKLREKGEVKIFLKEEIESNFDEVLKENRKCKEALKA